MVAVIENQQDDDDGGDVKAWPTPALRFRSAFLQLSTHTVCTVRCAAGPQRDRVAVAAL